MESTENELVAFQSETDNGLLCHMDIAKLVTSRLLIQAASGGGKSRALRYLLEQTFGVVPHIVFDTEGEFVTLRERFGYLLAGVGGEVSSAPSFAGTLCRRIVEIGASLVVDLSDLSTENRRRYVRVFLNELMALPRELWKPFLIVIDEAHLYAPERGSGESESTEAVIGLCSQGRKRGFAAILATQRLSKLHKDAAAELANKMIGRSTLDLDLRRAGDELGMTTAERKSLKEVSPGRFFAYGPAFDFGGVQLIRSGDVQTTHPEPGHIAPPAPPTPEAIRELAKALADLPEVAAEAEQNAAVAEAWKNATRTPAEMQADIDRLADALKLEKAKVSTGSVRVVEKPVTVEKIVEKRVEVIKEVPALAEAEIVRLEKLCESMTTVADGMTATAKDLRNEAAEVRSRLAAWKHGDKGTPAVTPKIPQVVPASIPNRPVAVTAMGPGPVSPEVLPSLLPEEVRLLSALAGYPANRLTRNQLSLLAQVSQGDGRSTWGIAITNMQSLGLIRTSTTYITLTPKGKATLAAVMGKAVSAPASAIDVWRRYLAPKALVMLQWLVSIRPRSATTAEVAKRSNLTATGGTFKTYLKSLRDAELVVIESTGKVRASDDIA